MSRIPALVLVSVLAWATGSTPAALAATLPDPIEVTFAAADSVPLAGRWYPGADTLAIVVAPRERGGEAARARAVEAFRGCGYSVLTFDYRDIDPRTASLRDSLRFIVFASRWVDDMVGALRLARERTGPRGRVFAWGQMVGGSVAVAAAARSRDLCDALVVEGLMLSTEEHLARIGTAGQPQIVDAHRRLVRDRDQPGSAASRARVPIYVVMAGRDSVVPITTTKEVYRGRRARTEILSLPEAGHEDAADAPRYFETVCRWLRRFQTGPRETADWRR
ncbi:MAG TPA: hypothetical protein VEY91_09905 [Candidatus Limnocylindria bacterium]|nr:hypothetical protein [Candidatus Limnocylindria bacterium]